MSTKIDEWLLEILVCPQSKAPLRLDEEAGELVCDESGHRGIGHQAVACASATTMGISRCAHAPLPGVPRSTTRPVEP